jgi:two-component system sensor histidine kinase BarA
MAISAEKSAYSPGRKLRMKKRDLKEWIMVLTIVPTMLAGLTLASYFTVNRFAEINTLLQQQATNITETLAIASETPLFERNKRKLKRLIYSSHRKNSSLINNIAIYDAAQQLVLFSGNQRDLARLSMLASQPLPTHTQVHKDQDYLVFYSPIYTELDTSEVTELVNDTLIGYIAVQINQNEALVGQKTALIVSFCVILLGLMISLFFSAKLVKRVIRPIRTMVTAINAIGAGTGNVYIEEDLTGELDLLKNGINTVAKSLNAIHLEMQINVDQTTSDLTETMEQIEIQNVELNLAKRKALEANRVKSEFLANMSHELRTPLNGVIGFTRQLFKTPLKDNQRDYLETISSSANSLLVIIDDILDFSKLDAGRMVFENIPFPLRDTINEVATLLAPGAVDKELEFSLRLSPDVPDDLIADPTRIKQVLVNLIGNAIKFTEKGRVTVDLSIAERGFEKVLLKAIVSDTGIGIQPQQQESLFAAFGQADSSITRRYGGTGLGLIISQKIAQEMHGNITMKSEMNRGSTFEFTFCCTLHTAPLSSALPIQSLAKRSLLYFEQDRHTRSATTELLESWGISVTALGDKNALLQLNKNTSRFDIALLSQKLSPNVFDEIKPLIDQIRPISDQLYLLTDALSQKMRDILLGSGIQACLSKPVNHRKLAKALSKTEQMTQQENQISAPVAEKLPLRVLAVDDNEANLKLITTLLLELVDTVDVTRNGAEALALCSIKRFDIIFMDIQMPIMDGITACQQIQGSSLNKNTPIIAVTAHALSGEKERLLEVGFNGYLTKPIDEQVLNQSIIQYSRLGQPQAGTIKQLPALELPFTPKEQVQATQAPQAVQKAQESVKANEEDQNLPQTKRIDWALARQRAGGKTDLAIDMLNMLLDSIPPARNSISQATDKEDPEAILKHVHKLHGACCYTGVPRLKSLAETIETHVKKTGDADDVMPELYELIDEMDNLLVDCADWRAGQVV